MVITSQLKVGANVGQITASTDGTINIQLPGLRGELNLAELEGVLHAARNLDRRLNPVTICKKSRRK